MAYSQDLRERVIAAVRAGEQSLSQIARTFGVSESTVDKWSRRWRETGRVAAKPWAGGPKRALRDCAAVIRAEVRKQPDLSIEELCERVTTATGVTASQSMMSRELARLKLPRKKRVSMTASVPRRG
jgi:transposase